MIKKLEKCTVDNLEQLQTIYDDFLRTSSDELSCLKKDYMFVFFYMTVKSKPSVDFIRRYTDKIKEINNLFFSDGSVIEFTYGYDETVFSQAIKDDSNTNDVLSKTGNAAVQLLFNYMHNNPAPVKDDFLVADEDLDLYPNGYDNKAYCLERMQWENDIINHAKELRVFGSYSKCYEEIETKVDDVGLHDDFVGQGISYFREDSGLTQKEFANKYHIKLSTLAHWEQGYRNPPEYVLYMIQEINKLEKELDKTTKKLDSVLGLNNIDNGQTLKEYFEKHFSERQEFFPVNIEYDGKIDFCLSCDAVNRYGDKRVVSVLPSVTEWGQIYNIVIE